MWWWWFLICWPAALVCYWLTRASRQPIAKPRPISLEHGEDNDNALLPTTSGDNGDDNAKELRRHGDGEATCWHGLSRWFERLGERKSGFGKFLNAMYLIFVPYGYRERSTIESGEHGLLVWVVSVRFWTYFLSRFLVFVFIVAPFVAMVLFYPHVWLGAAYGALPPPPPPIRPGTGVSASNGPFYEWHTVAGVNRVVPLCTHYDDAETLYESETSFLLSRDMLKDDKMHARCVVRLDGPDAHVLPFAAPYDALRATLAKAPPLNRVIAEQYGTWTAAFDVLNLSDAWRRPTLYVLRDGERYLRLAVRVLDKDGKARIERRLVSISALVAFLRDWQQDIARHFPGTALHYCMCPAFIGILDAIFFHHDPADNSWHVWLTAELTDSNTLTKHSGTREDYSDVVAPLPYWQNKWLVDDVNDTTGMQHVVSHYYAVTVAAIDVTGYVPSQGELDTRERFWLGHGTSKRAHDPNAPFAIAIPIDASQRTPKKLTGRDDTTCFFHCGHVLELLENVAASAPKG